MTARTDKELLHAAVDGALTDDEAARLRERLAEEASLRAEADRLRQLAGVVDSLGPEDLPESFSDRVMEAVARSHPEPATWRGRVRARLDQLLGRVPGHLQQERPGEAFVRWNTGWAGGGGIVAKKALWAAAGLAVVIILGVVYFNGTRTVDQDAQGTIGGAERYRGTQPSGVAVTEGDVQKFLQSDVFDRIIKDERVLKLLENKEARALLAEEGMAELCARAAVKAGLTDEEVANALRGDGFRGVMADSEAAAELTSRGLLVSLAHPDVLMALRDETTRNMLLDPEVAAELQKQGVQEGLKDPELVEIAIKESKGKGSAVERRKLAENADLDAALKENKLRVLLANDTIGAALRADTKLAVMVAQPRFASVIGNAKVRALLNDKAWETAARGQKLQVMLDDTEFAADLARNKNLQLMLGNPDVLSAIQNPEFMEALHSNRALSAALNSSALDSALARKKAAKK